MATNWVKTITDEDGNEMTLEQYVRTVKEQIVDNHLETEMEPMRSLEGTYWKRSSEKCDENPDYMVREIYHIDTIPNMSEIEDRYRVCRRDFIRNDSEMTGKADDMIKEALADGRDDADEAVVEMLVTKWHEMTGYSVRIDGTPWFTGSAARLMTVHPTRATEVKAVLETEEDERPNIPHTDITVVTGGMLEAVSLLMENFERITAEEYEKEYEEMVKEALRWRK